ncbi:ABC transporter ATP-binding protein [Paenibacillus amylolyticus]|uniref:ABC transporter ATP-binding protein n=1 Tax=Paenibacillus amylolyticus TaxID=1451 RepID=UPI003EB8DE0F
MLYSFIIPYLRVQKGKVIFLLLSIILGVALTVFNPQVVRYFIDTATKGGSWNALLVAAGIFTLTTIVLQLNQILSVYLGDSVGWKATNLLKQKLLQLIMKRDVAYINEHNSGEMLERVEADCNNLFTLLSHFCFQVLSNMLLLIGVITMFYIENWLMGTVILVFSIVTLWLLIASRGVVFKYSLKEREESTKYHGFMEERINGATDIHTNGAGNYVMKKFYNLHDSLFKASRNSWVAGRVTVWGTSVILIALGYVITFSVSVYLYNQNEISIGTVFLFFLYTELIFKPLEQITYQLQYLHGASASISRIMKLMDNSTLVSTKDSAELSLDSPIQNVRFEDVDFSYDSNTNVLKGISFSIAQGNVLGLVGRSGSGKSTIIRLLCKMYSPTRGKIELNSVNITSIDEQALLNKIAYVTQHVQLFQGTIRENITYFDESYSDQELTEVIRSLGIGSWYERLPNGLDTKIGNSGDGLSAGESQLLAFIRIFLRQPDIVLLDEYSSRIDPMTEQLLETALDKLLENRIGIVIAHRLKTVLKTDQIIVLDKGSIVEHGNTQALMQDPQSVFHKMLQSGMEEPV